MTPVALGLDYAYRVSPETLKCFRQHGVSFVVRYLCPPTLKKCLTKDEVAEIAQAGLNLVLVWETTADRAKAGRNAGLSDGTLAYSLVKGMGIPPCPIYFAVDYDAPQSDFAAIQDYLSGAAEGLHGEYEAGVYGSFAVVEGTNVKWNWQTYAWSHGKVSEKAQLWQFRNGANWCGASNDLNYAFAENFGQVGGFPLLPVPDVGGDSVTPDDVKTLQTLLNSLGANPALVVDGIFGPKTRAALQGAKVNATDAILANLARQLVGLAAQNAPTASVTAQAIPQGGSGGEGASRAF